MKLKEYTKKIQQENYDIPDVYNKIKTLANQKEYVKNEKAPKISIFNRPIFRLASLLIILTLSLTLIIVISSKNSKEEQYEGHKVLTVDTETNLNKIIQDTKAYQTVKTNSTRKVGCSSIKVATDKSEGEVNSSNGASGSSPDFSSTNKDSNTNNQVEGIEEADRVKYDENYIYYLYYNEIVIYKLSNTVSYYDTINYFTDENKKVHSMNMQLYENKLIVYYSYNDMQNNSRPFTEITIFDTTDNFKILKKVLLTGTNLDTRLFNSNLYIVTSEYISKTNLRPIIQENLTKEEINLEDVMYIRNCYNVGYTILTTINLENLVVNKKVQLGPSQYVAIYMSLNRVYLVSSIYSGRMSFQETTIYVYNISEENVTFDGYVTFAGKILDQYSIDEYEDMLRVASTNRYHQDPLKYNSVHIYDLNNKNEEYIYKQIGLLDEGIGEEYHEIKSVKFDKTHVNIVTYRNMDPLYDIDLTDPTKPKIVGKYKSPGYSSYLYKFSDEYMLGIGYDDDFSPKLSFYAKQNDTFIGVGEDYNFNSYDNYDRYVSYAYMKPSELLFIEVDSIMTFGIPVMVNNYTENNSTVYEYWIFQIDLNDKFSPIKLKARLSMDIGLL